MLSWERIPASVPTGMGSQLREEISDLLRARVPGGWLVMACSPSGETQALTFVPDREGSWRVELDFEDQTLDLDAELTGS